MNAKRPLLTAVENYRLQHVYPLHTPGHKGGRGADPALRHLVGDVALASDVSLMVELDDIHHPEGCIRETEELAVLSGRKRHHWGDPRDAAGSPETGG